MILLTFFETEKGNLDDDWKVSRIDFQRDENQ